MGRSGTPEPQETVRNRRTMSVVQFGETVTLRSELMVNASKLTFGPATPCQKKLMPSGVSATGFVRNGWK